MTDSVEALKNRARILHRNAKSLDAQALKQLRTEPELRKFDDEALLRALKRRHCLAAIAREFGFEGWSHAACVLGGKPTDDYGKLLYPRGCAAHTNIWSASYEEARDIREQHGGFLLAYQRQFIVVEDEFIRTMGLDPDDPDWAEMGRDWIKPADPSARQRLYGKLIDHAIGR